MKPSYFTLSAFLAVLIITVGVAIRLININQPLLEFFPQRQTQTAEITRNIYKNGWPDFWTPKVRYFTSGEPIPYVLEFPLYNGLVALLYHLFGPNVILGRLASLAFFVASSIIFYRLVKLTMKQFNNLTIFAILFFTFSPLHILISRSFQPEELALFLLLLAVYKKSWLIFSLAVLTKLPLALFAPVMFFAKPTKFRALLSLLPAAIWYYRASKLTIHPAIVRNFDISNWFQPQLWFKPNWYFSLFQIEHIWVLTTLGLLFFWLGLWQFSSLAPKLLSKLANLRVRLLPSEATPSVTRGLPGAIAMGDGERANFANEIAIWGVWLASGIFYLAIFNYHAMTHEYYHLFLLPPVSVIAGLGLTSIYSNVSKHWSQSIATAGIILMIISSLSLPAIRKIASAPKSPEKSTEVAADRYRLIGDF